MGKKDLNETVKNSFAYEKSADRLRVGLISLKHNHVEMRHPAQAVIQAVFTWERSGFLRGYSPVILGSYSGLGHNSAEHKIRFDPCI